MMGMKLCDSASMCDITAALSTYAQISASRKYTLGVDRHLTSDV